MYRSIFVVIARRSNYIIGKRNDKILYKKMATVKTVALLIKWTVYMRKKFMLSG